VKIAHVASETAPWSHSGGLADVVGALPSALRTAADDDAQVVVMSPLYRCVRERAHALGATLTDTGITIELELGDQSFRASVVSGKVGDALPVHFIDEPALFDRDGLYTDGNHRDFDDNAIRFGVLCKAAIAAAPRLLDGAPDVLHAHDWQAGLAPVFARTNDAVGAASSPRAVVFTIHNLAYRGLFDKDVVPALGLDWSLFRPDCLEFHDLASTLKGGVAFADAVTTVSPTYAREITTPAYGCGLDSFLQHTARRLTGILNGIDIADWDPATDPSLPTHYDSADLSGKRSCRAALAHELGFDVDERELLVGIVSRFASQKGLDLVADLAPELRALGVCVVVLGTGDPALEDRFRALAATPDSRLFARIAFDLSLARRIYAGCDAMLMPSRFEPCGLNQLYAMRYGTIPIVRAVGGLRDTVDDPGDEALARGEGTGFRFDHPDLHGLRWAVTRAAQMHSDDPEGWRATMRAGMARDCSWAASASAYLALYRELLSDRVHSVP
jgi:starch synthase